MKPSLPILTAAVLALSASNVVAEEVCMPKAEMKASLIDWYGERPVPSMARGETQVWVSDATGSWTVIRSEQNGTACVVAQGEQWLADLPRNEILASLAER